MSLFPSETTTMNATAYYTRWWIRQRFIINVSQDYNSTFCISVYIYSDKQADMLWQSAVLYRSKLLFYESLIHSAELEVKLKTIFFLFGCFLGVYKA